MSNLIKASSISYAEKIKTLDLNPRAEAAEKKYVDDYYEKISLKQIQFEEMEQKLEENGIVTPEDVDFTPGLIGEQVFVNDEPQITSEAAMLEERLSEKRRELDELRKQLEAVKDESEKILEDARAQVTDMLNEAGAEAENRKQAIYEQAREDGYRDGYAAAEGEMKARFAEADNLKQQYREDYEKQVEEIEPTVAELICRYVRKLTGIYSEDKREIILHLIEGALTGRHGDSNFLIRASEEDFKAVEVSKDRLRSFLPDGANLEVIMDRVLEKNQCVIETETRIFDCSLDSQLSMLIEDIRMLAEKD